MPVTYTYNIEPAAPVLAHSLLQPQTSLSDTPIVTGHKNRKSKPNPPEAWDLKPDIENGLQSSPDNVFRSGTVIGFSRLRGRAPDPNDDEFVGELPRYLLTKWLYRMHQENICTCKAFIIHPPNLNAFSPQKLLNSLLSLSLPSPHPPQQTTPTTPALSRNEAISYLDSVHLFPVFDFPAAVQAISEVSDTLHSLWTNNEECDDASRVPSVVLLIAGLDTLTEGVIRASNAVRGAAVLSSALRTLTQLSRVHRFRLSVVLVNTGGVGSVVYGDPGVRHEQARRDADAHSRRDEGIHSAFCAAGMSLFPSLLMKTLDQGIDTHLLLSRTKTIPVVEVVKDRVGTGLGKWCVWEGTR